MKSTVLATVAIVTALSLPLSMPVMAAAAPQDLGIAAVVGEDAISSYDVQARLRFIIVTAQLSDTPDVIEKLRPQVIRSLVDEKLQLQEAARKNIMVSDQEVKEAIAAIENQRGMAANTIFKVLEQNQVPKETFFNQIRAQLAWNKLVGKTLRQKVKITEQDITLASRRASAPPPPTVKHLELKIGLLVLPIDKPSRAADIKRLADQLVGEVRRGADFDQVARQFTGGAPKDKANISTFWVKPGQLEPTIAKALNGAGKGAVTDPIRSNDAFTIIKVYDTKDEQPKQETSKSEEVLLKEILLRLKPDAGQKEAELLLQIGEDVARNPGTCEEKGIASVDNLSDFDIEVNFRRELLQELPSGLRIIAESLKVGEISSPFASNEGIRLFMLCEKKDAPAKPVDRDRIQALLFQQRMELEAQKYMRNLRRETFIEVR